MRIAKDLMLIARSHKNLVNTPLFGVAISIAASAWFGGGNMSLTLPAMAISWVLFAIGSCIAFEHKSLRIASSTFGLLIYIMLIVGVYESHVGDNSETKEILSRLIAQDTQRVEAEYQKQLLANPAALIPDDKPGDTDDCSKFQPGSFDVVIGSVHYGAITFPYPAITVAGKPYIVINRTLEGITVSFDLFDKEGDILANINNNVIFVPPIGLSYIQARRDLHSLEVKDKRGNTKMYIYYRGKNQIIINGEFYVNGLHFVADENGTVLPGNNRILGGGLCGGGGGLALN